MKRILGVLLIIITISSTSCVFGPSTKRVMSYRSGKVYLSDRVPYKVGELPSTWKKLKAHTDVIAFYNEGAGSTIATDAFCGPAYEDSALSLLTAHLTGGIEAYEIVSKIPMTLDGRGALRTVARGKVDGVPLVFDIVVIKKNRCNIDFICVAPPDKHMDVSSDFESFYGAFQYE